jgi:RNA polymerase sigma factor (sigma-70 family)
MAVVQRVETRVEHWSGLENLRPAVRRFLRSRCKDDNEVEDVVQETLIRAARYRRGLTRAERLRPWVLRIAANVFRDRLKRSLRLPVVELDEEVAMTLEESRLDPARRLEGVWMEIGGRRVEREQVLSLLGESFERLAGRDREVLRSYYAGAGSCVQTADECGMDPALAKVCLFRARRRLEKRVRQRVAGLHVQALIRCC